MIYVTLKDGTELQYNNADLVDQGSLFYRIGKQPDINSPFMAAIAIDLIARVESIKPCRLISPPKRSHHALRNATSKRTVNRASRGRNRG